MAEASLHDKVAIVTGASRGIGKAMALGLAEAGASVVVAARTAEPRAGLPGTIHDTVAEIEARGGRALAVACNVREEDSIRDMVNTTLDEFGAVDVLVNNAGIGGYAPFLQMTLRGVGPEHGHQSASSVHRLSGHRAYHDRAGREGASSMYRPTPPPISSRPPLAKTTTRASPSSARPTERQRRAWSGSPGDWRQSWDRTT